LASAGNGFVIEASAREAKVIGGSRAPDSRLPSAAAIFGTYTDRLASLWSQAQVA
jgi:hypothetical protein